MRKIYVAMEALRSQTAKPDAYLGYGVSEYARPFLTWASTQGTVVLLTDEPLARVKYLLNKIQCSDKVSVRGFESCKTEAMRHDEDFYWVDDALIPSETSWLAEHKLGDRLVAVHTGEGITPAAKQALEDRLRAASRRHN